MAVEQPSEDDADDDSEVSEFRQEARAVIEEDFDLLDALDE